MRKSNRSLVNRWLQESASKFPEGMAIYEQNEFICFDYHPKDGRAPLYLSALIESPLVLMDLGNILKISLHYGRSIELGDASTLAA